MNRKIIAGSQVCIITIGLLFVISTLITKDVKATSWSIEIVDSGGNVGLYSSIAIDSLNQPHISYLDLDNSYLKYAKWNGTAWDIETVDTSGFVGIYSSLALDSNDFAHISYIDWASGNLKYASWNGTAWNIEFVDLSGAVVWDASISLDSKDNPHISYYDNANGDLRYAAWNGSSWNIEVVDSTDYVGLWTSIAIDGNDYPHISYRDETNQDLKYARWNGSSWNIETVDWIGDVGLCTSITIDSSDFPHISYFELSNRVLKYAKWDGNSWEVITIDSTAWVGWFTSIELDSDDDPHISYYDFDYTNLKYARWMENVWALETVDSNGDVGVTTSLALDNNDVVHISYLDFDNGDLKYAKSLPNNPPNTPSSITGPVSGRLGSLYSFFTHTSDPDNDMVKYTIDWDDGTTSESEYVDSTLYVRFIRSWADCGTYDLRVKATDINGASSDWSDPHTISLCVVPTAPLDLSATPGDRQVTLTWNPPADDGDSPITNNTISRGTISGGATPLAEINTTTTYTDTGLTNGQTYYYVVSARNAIGEGQASSEVNATPVTVPSEPLNLRASVGDNQIVLTWDAPTQDGGSAITNYSIYRGTTNGSKALLITIGNILNYTDLNVTNDQTYYYEISAVNEVGEGPRSEEVSAALPTEDSGLIGSPWFWLAVIFLILIPTILLFLWHRKKKNRDGKLREESVDVEGDDGLHNSTK